MPRFKKQNRGRLVLERDEEGAAAAPRRHGSDQSSTPSQACVSPVHWPMQSVFASRYMPVQSSPMRLPVQALPGCVWKPKHDTPPSPSRPLHSPKADAEGVKAVTLRTIAAITK